MLQNLTIEGFRGFKHFKMGDLGRINLLVGTNNSGKTSVLEAIEILTTVSMDAIWNAMSRRGEHIFYFTDRNKEREGDICHLFHGHILEVGREFQLKGQNGTTKKILTASIQEAYGEEYLFEGEDPDDEYMSDLRRLITLKSNLQSGSELKLPLSPSGGISFDVFRRNREHKNKVTHNTRFVSTDPVSQTQITSMFDDIKMMPEEKLVIQALRTIDPTIKDIATIGSIYRYPGSYQSGRGGIIVKCTGIDQRIPIGSFGDGIWRMLGLALSLVHAKDGILLIDEIDTGLHYTVMENMWKMVNETAKRLNIQVFATTHSQDAVNSLASIAKEDRNGNSQVTIQRIERENGLAVAYTESEIIAAAEHGIEVR